MSELSYKELRLLATIRRFRKKCLHFIFRVMVPFEYKRLLCEIDRLERELNECKMICEGLRKGNRIALQPLNQSFADTERLDWLQGNSGALCAITREAIDAAIDAEERYELKQEKLQMDARNEY